MSQDLFDKAIRLEEDGQLECALELWREIASSSPTRNVFLRYGGAAKELRLLDEAETAFGRALKIDGRSALAMMQLGIIALDRQDYETAEAYLRGACAAEEDPGRFTLLGVALRNLGKDLDAEEAYRTALRLDPKYEEAHFNLGVLLRDDRPSEAQALFREALELDPNFAAAHRELGFLLGKRGHATEAEEHLRKSIDLQPNDAWAHIYLGTQIWGADSDSAVKEFHRAQEICPDWTVPLWSLGNIHECVLHDFDLAQSFYESALRLDPDDVVTLTNFGRLCKRRGNFEQAKHYLGRALRLDPLTPKVRDLFAGLGDDRSR